MKILERGGAAAASMIERLREAQRRIEPLEVSPDSLWLCREHELLAPLLEWSGPDEALRPFVEAPKAAAAPPARLPVAGMISHRRRGFLSAPDLKHDPLSAARLQGPAANPRMAGQLETNQRVARILAEAAAEPDARRGHPESGTRAIARTLTQAVTEPGEHRNDQGSVSGATAVRSLQEARARPSPPGRGRREAPGEGRKSLRNFEFETLTLPSPRGRGWKRPYSREPQTAGAVYDRPRFFAQTLVSREEAARRLQSLFAGDERLLRAWDRVITETPPSTEVSAILAEPDSRRMIRMDGPADPISVLLEPVVDRAGRKPSTKTNIEPPGSRLLSPESTSGEAMRPRWDSLANREETSRQFGEPPRTSALRRLASYGETIEPERVLSMPSPSPAAPKEAPQQQSRVAFERADLAQEVSEIFRREALRHGIVSEEDTP